MKFFRLVIDENETPDPVEGLYPPNSGLPVLNRE